MIAVEVTGRKPDIVIVKHEDLNAYGVHRLSVYVPQIREVKQLNLVQASDDFMIDDYPRSGMGVANAKT